MFLILSELKLPMDSAVPLDKKTSLSEASGSKPKENVSALNERYVAQY